MERINIAEILKDCPRGMELDCTMYENLYFDYISNSEYSKIYPIHCYTEDDMKAKYPITFTLYGRPSQHDSAKCVIFPKGKSTWEGFHKPFEDGDIVAFDAHHLQIFIFKDKKENSTLSDCYLMFDVDDDELYLEDGMYYVTRFATEEEKQKLFDAIKAKGYKWNTETKTLEKSTPKKFDINTLVPFESRVLVRDSIDGIEEYDGECSAVWRPATMGVYIKDTAYPFGVVGGCYFRYCIPYEGNEHLLGTTDDCDEYFKTW